MSITISGCQDKKAYPIHIHEGMNCTTPGMHWDIPRGEGITDVMCLGTRGSSEYTRLNTDPKPWSISTGQADDIVGLALVLHDPDMQTVKISCGVITKQ